MMAVSRFGEILANNFLGSAHDNSPFGKIWYVDGTNGADGNAGDAPDEAYATIAAAILSAVADRGDSVVIRPGTYTITAALVPKAMMTFRAAVVGQQRPTVVIQGAVAELVTVDVSGTRWVGLEFRGTSAACLRLVDIADGAAVNGAMLEDCRFSTTRGGATGVSIEDATNIGSGVVVRGCLFDNEAITQLAIGILGAPLGKIEDNTFLLTTTTSTGIAFADTVGGEQLTDFAKGHTIVRQNDFIGLNSAADVGITISGTEDLLPISVIRNNFFSGFAAAAITANVATTNLVNNYVGDTGTGGTLIDAGN